MDPARSAERANLIRVVDIDSGPYKLLRDRVRLLSHLLSGYRRLNGTVVRWRLVLG